MVKGSLDDFVPASAHEIGAEARVNRADILVYFYCSPESCLG
jgi:hypothetical protein